MRSSCGGTTAFFGGGTAIALRYGEFRQSVDVDLLVSDRQGYRELRLIRRHNNLQALWKDPQHTLEESREPLTDQYGIRAGLVVAGVALKLEIVLEGRICLDPPGPLDAVSGVATLTLGDLICSKLLANSDRWNDDGVFNRDLIDLAHLPLTPGLWRHALAKAEDASGDAIRIHLGKALERLQQREGGWSAAVRCWRSKPHGRHCGSVAQPATVGRRHCAGRLRVCGKTR